MGLDGGSYSGPQEIRYLFVDGGYLRKVAEKFGGEFFGVDELPINYVLGARFTKCFYYDCLPAQRGNEALHAYEARVSEQRAVEHHTITARLARCRGCRWLGRGAGRARSKLTFTSPLIC